MAKKLNYNMHAAIELRGQTIDQAGFYDIQSMHPITKDQVINFRTSIEMTGGDYDYGNIPFHVEVIMGNGNYTMARQTFNKERWRKAYTGWRTYIHESGDPREPEPKIAGEWNQF